jgi:hypothetical protein
MIVVDTFYIGGLLLLNGEVGAVAAKERQTALDSLPNCSVAENADFLVKECNESLIQRGFRHL